MPRPRKHPKPERPVNRQFKEIRARPSNLSPDFKDPAEAEYPGTRLTQGLTGQLGQASSQPPTALSNTDLSQHTSFSDGSEPLRNGDSAASQPQHFPAGRLFDPSSSTKTGNVEPEAAIKTSPNVPSPQILRGGIYAVNVEAKSSTQPVCAVFNSTTEYSCMIASIAKKLLNVKLRNTTPGQRLRWYSTPAGQICEPQRYAELTLRAFDPYIPTVKLIILLLEGDGPIDGVHVYLGRSIFTKLSEMGFPLSVREVSGPRNNFNSHATEQHENAVRISYAAALEGPATTTVPDKETSSSEIPSHFAPLPISTVSNTEPLWSSSGFEPNGSLKTVSSKALSWPSEIMNVDSSHALKDAWEKYMKSPTEDVSLGPVDVEFDPHHGEVDSDNIDPALLRDPTQDFVSSWSEGTGMI